MGQPEGNPYALETKPCPLDKATEFALPSKNT